MTPLAEAKSVQLICRLAGEDFQVDCDPERMLQVFSNLVGNAIKFTDPNTEVVLEAALQADQARFTIEDHGPGIPPDHQKHIFDLYWQAERTAHLGTGLGLSIASTLIKEHQGRITVESALGSGTRFHVFIPNAKAMRESAAA
jgi:signal transduction histidine kinase